MAPKRQKENSSKKTSSRDHNPFSILESDPQPASKPSTRHASPDPDTRPTSKHSHDNLIRIPARLSTIQSRVLSFKEWPHSNITLQQLAKFGFYHQPDDTDNDLVMCFTCGIGYCKWEPEKSHVEELLSLHDEDCIWADLLQETQSLMEASESRPTTPIHHPSTLDPENQERELESDADGCEQSCVFDSSSTSSPRPTYASILKSSHQHQPPTWQNFTPTTNGYWSHPSPTPTATLSPTLTIKDLRNRFHNKPSPFKLAGTRQISTNRNHLTAVATEALSNFLLSSLPAFSGFLSDIYMGSCRDPSQDQRSSSRWPTNCGGR